MLYAVPLSRRSANGLPVPRPETKPLGPMKPAEPPKNTDSCDVLLTSSFLALLLTSAPALKKCLPKTAEKSSLRTLRSWLFTQGDWFQRLPWGPTPQDATWA